ncbi:MAG: hypothetical protein O3B47_02000 [bacterium]|nr:hypothetical protein [bacterium]
MKTSNIDVEQLRRSKKSSPESKFEWLFSALSFGKAKKVVIKRKTSK